MKPYLLGHQRPDHLKLAQPCPPRGCATVVCAERRDRFSDLLDNPNRLRQDLIQSPAFTAQSLTPGEALDLLDHITQLRGHDFWSDDLALRKA
jgi:hypothetical protein